MVTATGTTMKGGDDDEGDVDGCDYWDDNLDGDDDGGNDDGDDDGDDDGGGSDG
jgi:hypothetical protein